MNEKQIELFWKLVDKRSPDECWEWIGKKTRDGYGSLHRNGKAYSAHRASYEISAGKSPAGFVVMHTCDNPACVNPAHLRLGTIVDNMQDMIAKGRQSKTYSKRTRLTEAQVVEIRRSFLSGESKMSLSRRFGVVAKTIRQIVRYEIWKNVQVTSASPEQR